MGKKRIDQRISAGGNALSVEAEVDRLLAQKLGFRRFDPVNYLKTDADIASYRASAAEDGDPEIIASVEADIPRVEERRVGRRGRPRSSSPSSTPGWTRCSRHRLVIGMARREPCCPRAPVTAEGRVAPHPARHLCRIVPALGAHLRADLGGPAGRVTLDRMISSGMGRGCLQSCTG